MSNVLSAIKNGKFEQEEMFDMLELYFKQLEQHIIDLSSTQPVEVPTPDSPKDEDASLLAIKTALTTTKLKLKLI